MMVILSIAVVVEEAGVIRQYLVKKSDLTVERPSAPTFVLDDNN